MAQSSAPTFVADCTLGQLAKQLRLAGLDTLLDRRTPDSQRLSRMAGGKRIVLTRSTRVKKQLASRPFIFIRDDQPRMQVRQVMAALNLRREDLRPLVRCCQCNRILETITRDQALGRIPEYVWQQHASFKTCGHCQRIYWPGSHAQRWLERMEGWFG